MKRKTDDVLLRQTVREDGRPFDPEIVPNQTTVDAIEEGRRIAYDPSQRGYRDMKSLRAALDV